MSRDRQDESDPIDQWLSPEAEEQSDLGPPIPDSTPEVEGLLGPPGTPRELLVGFWVIVILANIGLFAVSLGAMLLFFRGAFEVGGALLVVGLVALGRAYWRYRGLARSEPPDE